MRIELRKEWQFIDGSQLRRLRIAKVPVSVGTHEVEIISNPWPKAQDQDYLVLAGTMIGLSLQYLKTFEGEGHGIHRVIITENG